MLIGTEGADSWGISGTGETRVPYPLERNLPLEEAHRPPPGKRVPGVEVNNLNCRV
ncbi:hypothetical protein [Rossellomorea vietnamensis]|uniref:hypothetical protein n=1 Tax=Rossellomorea vietnamensis TaxID=218284 RepID=UPI0016535DC5|nr:hypothetical protein [Rossellomorea vietnamensis]